jgi:hypothetical protein
MRLINAFLLICLISCSSNKKVNDIKSLSADSNTKLTISDLSGDWVNLKYLHSIQKTRSPKISQGIGEFSYVTFSRDTALFIFGFHEGSDLKVIADKPNRFFCAGYDNDTIWMIVSNDTLIINHKGTQETYLKYQMSLPNDEFGNRLLNKEIFSGDYVNVDSPGQSVSFSDNGNVKGFLDYSTYFVSSDYYDAGCDFDIIYLRKKTNDRVEYTWNFSKDTLMIYKLDCQTYDSTSEMCVETKIGKLQYRLIKK